MIRLRHLLAGCALASCASALAAQSYPQGYPQSPYPSAFAPVPVSDADLLTRELRTLAADPTNLYALLNAARLSLKLGDTDAAAALYTRAEKVSPANPSVKAGMARLLVNAQRPGEALRLFAEAAAAGANPAEFGSDRALAYDLIGEQERAQREYRALLAQGPDDETTRRYALSLGISGLKEPALAVLEPLNRRSDRGAWRARAFVLAMNADRSGAEKIATTMMPAGMADGLKPFFDRLPKLAAVDRAFAVHFGEVRGNAVRYADARRAPPLPALAPEANPFPPSRAAVQVAAAEPATGKKKKRKKDRDAPAVTRVAARSYVAPLPPPPAPTATQLAALSASRVPAPGAMLSTGGGGRPTVLPPPADAYRPGETRLAANLPAAVRPLPTAGVPDDGGDEPDDPVAAARSPAFAATTVLPVASTAGRSPVTQAGTPLAAVGSATVPKPGFGTQPLSGSVGTSAVAAKSKPPSAAALAMTRPSAPAGASLVLQQSSPVATPPAAAPSVAAQVTAASPAPIGVSASAVQPTQLAAAAQSPTTNTGSAAIASFATTPAATAQPQLAPATAAPPASVVAAAPLGAPPPPAGASGDAVLAAIVASIKVPEAELAPALPTATGTTPLLTTIEKKRETAPAVAAAKLNAASATLPRKDARGRFVDAAGKPLLDPGGRLLGPKAAAAWLAAQTAPAATMKKDARGRFLDAKGKPLLDTRGRSLGEQAALARLAAQTDEPGAATAAGKLPKRDARGRFVDAKGKPLLDPRGRPLTEKAAAAWLAANDGQRDDGKFAGKTDARLPKKDARGRFVDAKGKPLLDARGRPLTEKAAAAWLAAGGKSPADAKADTVKGEPQRYWVQVAGGANEDTLAKEWKRVSGSAAALKGKQGWTTPLRATNRVLTGPFKSSAEAMAMVNTLKKQGVAAFMFTSDAGQKVTRLGAD